jgi:hypothetical protein
VKRGSLQRLLQGQIEGAVSVLHTEVMSSSLLARGYDEGSVR